MDACRAQSSGSQYGLNEEITVALDAGRYPALVEEMCSGLRWGSGPTANMPLGEGTWGASSADPGETTVLLALPTAPETTTRITLVDPESEKRLLGARGAFMDPLIDVDTTRPIDIDRMADWAQRIGGDYGDRFASMLRQQLGAPSTERMRSWPTCVGCTPTTVSTMTTR